jgi:hypothetical protein
MIGTPRDLFKGCYFRDDFDGEWITVKDLKPGTKSTQVKVSDKRWVNIMNETGLQITGPGRPRKEK